MPCPQYVWLTANLNYAICTHSIQYILILHYQPLCTSYLACIFLKLSVSIRRPSLLKICLITIPPPQNRFHSNQYGTHFYKPWRPNLQYPHSTEACYLEFRGKSPHWPMCIGILGTDSNYKEKGKLYFRWWNCGLFRQFNQWLFLPSLDYDQNRVFFWPKPQPLSLFICLFHPWLRFIFDISIIAISLESMCNNSLALRYPPESVSFWK